MKNIKQVYYNEFVEAEKIDADYPAYQLVDFVLNQDFFADPTVVYEKVQGFLENVTLDELNKFFQQQIN